jgi:hypothetical protein
MPAEAARFAGKRKNSANALPKRLTVLIFI